MTLRATAIVLNFDGAGVVEEAVESLLAQDQARQLEVVVVDNGSRDGSDLALERRYERRIRLIRTCLLYTSPSPRDRQKSRMPSSA